MLGGDTLVGTRTRMNNQTIAIIIVILILAFYWLVIRKGSKEGFASARAHQVYDKSRELFDKSSGKASYSEYKQAIPSAEAVLYTDTRNLWKKGTLSPDNVQSVLG